MFVWSSVMFQVKYHHLSWVLKLLWNGKTVGTHGAIYIMGDKRIIATTQLRLIIGLRDPTLMLPTYALACSYYSRHYFSYNVILLTFVLDSLLFELLLSTSMCYRTCIILLIPVNRKMPIKELLKCIIIQLWRSPYDLFSTCYIMRE